VFFTIFKRHEWPHKQTASPSRVFWRVSAGASLDFIGILTSAIAVAANDERQLAGIMITSHPPCSSADCGKRPKRKDTLILPAISGAGCLSPL